jgi:hypothetical protein
MMLVFAKNFQESGGQSHTSPVTEQSAFCPSRGQVAIHSGKFGYAAAAFRVFS